MEGGGINDPGVLGLLLLQAASKYSRLDRKPPVTTALIAANTIIYLRPKFLHPYLPTLNQVSFNPYLILKDKDLKRLLLSALYHIDEPHLIYNMLSLLWNGIQLENAMGSVEFASMVTALVGMSQGITLLLAKFLLLFDYERPYYNEYAVGFSGVLFAMTVVRSQSDNYTNVLGLKIPARYASWAVLILGQMLDPRASFLGHLGGILAGFLYVKLKGSSNSGANPFVKIIRCATSLLGLPLRFINGMLWPSSRGRRGTPPDGVWRCGACTYDDSGWLSACEVCGGGRNGNFVTDTETISVEELRQRRVRRFGRGN